MLKKLEAILDQLYEFKPAFLSVGVNFTKGLMKPKTLTFNVFDHTNYTHEFNSFEELENYVNGITRADKRRQILFRKF